MRYQEPGSIAFQRGEGDPPIMEPTDHGRIAGAEHFIIRCSLAGKEVLIGWWAFNATAARASFLEWLGSDDWKTFTTDFYGNPAPHGYDFKTILIDHFAVMG